MKSAARPGLTVMEVLIAASLSAVILGLAIQQVTEYFRLQQVLVSRTELRHSLKVAADLMAAKLRYANVLVRMENGSGVTIAPLDVDEDGTITAKDQMELVYWYAANDPLHPERECAFERSVQVPAFTLPSEPRRIAEFFDGAMGKGRRLAPQVSSVRINLLGGQLFELHLTAKQQLARQSAPVELSNTQIVAVRSKPLTEELPSFEEALANWRYRP